MKSVRAGRGFAVIIGVLPVLLSAGCAIQPRPLDATALKRVNAADHLAAVASEPISGPLTIEEATARVL